LAREPGDFASAYGLALSPGRTLCSHLLISGTYTTSVDSTQGSKWLRWAMVEASIHAVRKPGPLKRHFERLRRKKGYKVAIVASARKHWTGSGV